MKDRILLMIILCLGSLALAQKPTYNIGILIDIQNERTLNLLEQLQNQIKAVVGEDATVYFPEDQLLANEFDKNRAQQQYQQLLDNETDIILAFGTLNHQLISKQPVHSKPTILFGTVNQDIIGLDLAKEKSGVDNLYYLVESESYKNDLQQLKQLTGFKNVGIAVRKGILQALPLAPTFDAIMAPLDADYRFLPFESSADLLTDLNGIDAIYFINGFYLNEVEVKQIAQTLIAKKIPSFTLNGIEQVNNGLMATHQPSENVDLIIRRLALTVERYINGTPLSEMPVWLNYTPQLTLNYNTAEATGVPIKMTSVAKTDFVGKTDEWYAENKYTLDQVIRTALSEQLALKAAQRGLALEQQNIELAKSAYLPSLVANVGTQHLDPDVAVFGFGQSPEFQTTGSLNLQQVVFSESANANIDISKIRYKAKQEEFNKEQLNTIFETANAYFNILIAKTNFQLQLKNLEMTKKNYQMAEQNFTAGLRDKADMLRFRSQMAQHTQVMVEAANQLDQELNTLNQLLNNPIGTKIDVESVQLDEALLKSYNYDELIKWLDHPDNRTAFLAFLKEEAKTNAPELKALGYDLEAVDRTLQFNTKGRFLPSIMLQGQHNTVFNRSGSGSTAPEGLELPNNFYSLGLNVSVPIFNRKQFQIRKQNALIEKDQLQLIKEQTVQTMDVNIHNAVLNLTSRIANIELSAVSEETAQEALQLTQAAYSGGAANSVQLIDAQNNLLNAELQRATAVYNYLVNTLYIERLMGHFFMLHSDEENQRLKQRMLARLESWNNQ